MRFLHLADVHLDTPFVGRSAALRARLRAASREALANAVDCALSEGVDVVLLAGDLFDGERLSFGTELFLLRQLARLDEARVPVIYVTGNHDPGGGGGRRAVPWPPNVTVVEDARVRRIPVLRGGAPVGFVTAAGHATSRETADLSRSFPRPVGEFPEVALLHTQVGGAGAGEDHEPYAPSELSRLLASGYDYWALGHVHLRQQLSVAPAVHYPGNLQGRTPREIGPKGGLLVDLQAPDTPRVGFRPFAPVRFETLEVRGLEGEATLPGLVARVARAWHDARREEGGSAAEWIVRVVLSGPTPLGRELDDEDERAALATELTDVLQALDVEVRTRGTHAVYQTGDHSARQDVLGQALRLLADVRAGRVEVAGLEAADLVGFGARDDLHGFLRELLEDGVVEDELLVRFLGGDAR